MGGARALSGSFDEVLGIRPDLAAPYREFLGLFWARSLIDPVALDLCRLRVAQLLGCEAELGVRTRPAVERGLSEEQVRRLSRWPDAGCFTMAQRAALAFAEQFVLDPHGVTDELRDDVRDHFAEPGLVALVEALALFDGFTRFRLALCAAESVTEVVDPPSVPSTPFVLPEDADPALTSSVLAQQPETLAAFLRLYGILWSHGTVDQPLKEVARLRNARITDCGY
jgi:alkylhydroperoxidase family enzyme